MVEIVGNTKQRITQFNSFFYSEYFPLTVGIVCAFSWIMQAQTLCMLILSVVSTYILFTQEDMTPLIAPLVLLCFCIHDPSKLDLIKVACIGIPLVCGAMYHLVEYKGRNGFGKMFIPFVILIVAMCLGGVNSPYLKYFGNSVMYIGGLGFFLLLLYLLFYKYMCPPEGFDLRIFICTVFESAAIAGILELVFRWTTENEGIYDLALFGWGTYNQIGACCLIAYPCFFYMMCRTNKLCPNLLLAGLVLVVCMMSGSDGTKGLIAVFTPLLILFSIGKMAGTSKKIFKCIFIVMVAGAIIVAVYLAIKHPLLVEDFIKHFTKDAPRNNLYETGYKDFINYPIFGVGLGQPLAMDVIGGNFHCTLIHVAATMGIVGVIAYLIYFIARIRIINSDIKPFNLFMLFSFVMLECYGFVDTCEFTPFPIMMEITFIVLFCDVLHERKIQEPDLSVPQLRQEIAKNKKHYKSSF